MKLPRRAAPLPAAPAARLSDPVERQRVRERARKALVAARALEYEVQAHFPAPSRTRRSPR